MPIPSREKGEEAHKFMGRCMTSDVMKSEYPDQKQRVAICTQKSRADGPRENLPAMVQEELVYSKYQKDCECGEVEELTESKSEPYYIYEDPITGEVFTYKRPGIYRKNGRTLVFRGVVNGDTNEN